jgi:hypothetical protein
MEARVEVQFISKRAESSAFERTGIDGTVQELD